VRTLGAVLAADIAARIADAGETEDPAERDERGADADADAERVDRGALRSREAMGMDLPEHARINQAAWNVSAGDYVDAAHRNWAAEEISWGIWDVPEAQVKALPDVDASTSSSSGAGRRTYPRGSRGGVLVRSASISPRTSSRPLARSRTSMGSSSR
jgi:hypothetical protein